MTQAYAQLLHQVQTLRRSWHIRRLAEALTLTAAAGVGLLVVLALLDSLFDWSRTARLLAAALLWATVGVLLWRQVGRLALQRHSDDFYAALAEQTMPQLGNRLINALQLGRQPAGIAPFLIDAVVQDGVRAAEEVDTTTAARSPQLARRSAALAAVVLVSLAHLTLGGPGARVSYARVLLPTADIAPFAWTRLTLTSDAAAGRVLEGEPVTVTVATSGRRPEGARLRWTDSEGRQGALAMTPVPGDTQQFRHTFATVERGMTLRAEAGDGRSSALAIAVDPRPRIERIDVTYRYPQYAALPDRTVSDSDGHLQALAQTQATLTVHAGKDLEQLTLLIEGEEPLALRQGSDARTWTGQLTMARQGAYRLLLRDVQGYEVTPPAVYSISVLRDAAPVIAFTVPGRDVQVQPDEQVRFALVASDDLGLGAVTMFARINPLPQDEGEAITIHAWPELSDESGKPQRRVELDLERSVAALGLKAGDRMLYWATAVDRAPAPGSDADDAAGDMSTAAGPGTAQTRMFNLIVLTSEQADQLMAQQLTDYAKVVEELIKLQRLNRVETAGHQPGQTLVERQVLIRRQTRQLADVMQRQAFAAESVITTLRELAAQEMAQVIVLLEGYRDGHGNQAEPALARADESLPVQDGIIAALEEILDRLNRNEQVRKALKKIKDADPVAHERTLATLDKVAQELDAFLNEMRDINERYERLPKRDLDEFSSEDLANLNDIETRLDRWKQWSSDTVDEITKLPEGFVADSHLAENVSTIFEEIEKKERDPMTEIATPLEEGIKALAEEVAEDLEMWMPDKGDSVRWVMEDPVEGTFDVPEAKLPESLQDMIGDLIEDLEEFDTEADDTTGAWGGNMQVGWDIMDGPISSFAALGKTGNQLPNESEMTGRSGAGRRGRASGQMVGAESRALEGRPTPARLTNERYEEGNVDASKQLDPRGATGGGKKTGAGRRGLQGGTPPDFVRDLDRLEQHQELLRERAQQVANQLDYAGRPSLRVQRALDLLGGAQQDLRDLRYDDAARKRKAALGELRAVDSGIDAAVNLSLQRAPHVPPELRQQIVAGSQQPLPQGYESLVSDYYKALSAAAGEEER